MSDLKLFRIHPDHVEELQAQGVAVEKSLQTLIERHLEPMLGVRFLATEYSTGPRHGGRIDTLGLDENGSPVIIEYKRALNENVINQGLFYLDWLLDHRAEFKLLVMERLGAEAAEQIDWTAPRLICIAGDFTRYDEHAIQQIHRSIELMRYRRYGDDLLLLELVGATVEQPVPIGISRSGGSTFAELLEKAPTALRDRFEALRAFCLALGDDVQEKTLKHYAAFKRIKNFACVEVHPQKGTLLVYVKLDPEKVALRRGFTRDVRKVGHYGTGDLEITIRSDEDLAAAQPLIAQSYEAS